MDTAPASTPVITTSKPITLTIDGKSVTVDEGTTIWDAARVWNELQDEDRIDIPGLCHRPELGYEAVGVCRLCSVNVVKDGRPESVYAAACMRQCTQGMVVIAADHAEDADEKIGKARAKLRDARSTLTELLLAEHPSPCAREKYQEGSCELEAYGRRYGLLKDHYTKKSEAWLQPTVFKDRVPEFIPKPDTSNFSIAIDHSACILCDRCIRACAHPSVDNRIIGRTGKGMLTRIGFDNDLPMKDSACVNCGWCMVSCPTGAITFAGQSRAAKPPVEGGVVLSAKEMQRHELIQDGKISIEFLKRSENGVVIKRYRKGEIVCRQNAYENTAFYVNSGSVDVYVSLPTHRAADTEKPGILARLFGSKQSGGVAGSGEVKLISIGSGIEVDSRKPVTRLGVGELFGEAACLNGQARSATIEVAEDDTEILVMTRNFLDVLMRNRVFRTKIEKTYARRAIENRLKASPVLAGMSPEFRESLHEKATIVRYKPGDIIINQGDISDAFYIVHLGHVKVDRILPNGTRLVLRYLPAGSVFGEIGVLKRDLRTATCIALDNVELVRIGQSDFDELVTTFPEIGKRMHHQASTYTRGDDHHDTTSLPGHKTAKLDEYLDQQLYQGQRMLVIDLDKCTRCDECVRACAQSHVGVSRLIRDGLRYENYLVTTSCRSCRDPKCLVGCPVDAIHRKEGLPIIIDPDKCTGCGKCSENCPFGNITMHEVEKFDHHSNKSQMGPQAFVCDLDRCVDENREPSCVYACPHDAAHRVDGPKFFGVNVLGPQ